MIAERQVQVAQGDTRVLEVDGPRPEHPVLMVHGNPSNAGDWKPFLERLEGRRRGIAPDLLGWGKSDRPAAFPGTMEALAGWLGDAIDALSVQRFDLVVHDWGGIALVTASRRPEAVDRVVVMNSVPLMPDYRWHWIARLWRRRGVGELLNATTSKFGTRQLLRPAFVKKDAIPELADLIHEHFDRGTKRAVLDLYRDADPEKFAPIAAGLKSLTGPSLIVWGDADPFIQARFAESLSNAFGGQGRVEHLPDAGHWPWLDRPDVVDTVCDFLTEAETKPAAP
jgi:pimeloyl-ACP methyl ester carboxylesterase